MSRGWRGSPWRCGSAPGDRHRPGWRRLVPDHAGRPPARAKGAGGDQRLFFRRPALLIGGRNLPAFFGRAGHLPPQRCRTPRSGLYSTPAWPSTPASFCITSATCRTARPGDARRHLGDAGRASRDGDAGTPPFRGAFPAWAGPRQSTLGLAFCSPDRKPRPSWARFRARRGFMRPSDGMGLEKKRRPPIRGGRSGG